MKAIIVRCTFISYLVAAALLIGGEAAASVIYRLAGTVVEADEAALPDVGDHVSGFVELSNRAFFFSPPYVFALGRGDVLDIFIRFGPYVWDLDRPSVRLGNFEGVLTPDKRTFAGYSIGMSENFFGVISDEYCLPRQVCVLTGGGNFVIGMHDGRGFSAARVTWTLRGRRIPEPSTISIVGLALAALAWIRRRKPRHQTSSERGGRMATRSTSAVTAVLLVTYMAAQPIQAAPYLVTDLGDVTEGSLVRPFLAQAINDSRQIAGMALFPGGYPALVWNAGTITKLPLLPGDTFGQPFAINNSGQVAGISGSASGYHAALFSRGLATQVAPTVDSLARSINAMGVVVGASNVGILVGQAHPTAFYWQRGVYNELPHLSGSSFSSAADINAAGTIVGISRVFSSDPSNERPVVWEGGVATELPDLPGGAVRGAARTINALGWIAGASATDSGDHAALWRNGSVFDLGVRAGTTNSIAYDMNNRGLAVGNSTRSGGDSEFRSRATLWDPLLGALDLNDQVDDQFDWTLITANGVNNNGAIFAYGRQFFDDGTASEFRTFLLTPTGEMLLPPSELPPVPTISEPSTLALIGLVFGGIGLWRCKRLSA